MTKPLKSTGLADVANAELVGELAAGDDFGIPSSERQRQQEQEKMATMLAQVSKARRAAQALAAQEASARIAAQVQLEIEATRRAKQAATAAAAQARADVQREATRRANEARIAAQVQLELEATRRANEAAAAAQARADAEAELAAREDARDRSLRNSTLTTTPATGHPLAAVTMNPVFVGHTSQVAASTSDFGGPKGSVYYHGAMAKNLANEVLLDGEDSWDEAAGKFLLRDKLDAPGVFILSVVHRDRIVHNLVGMDTATSRWRLNRKPLPPRVASFDNVLEYLRTKHSAWPCVLTRGVTQDAVVSTHVHARTPPRSQLAAANVEANYSSVAASLACSVVDALQNLEEDNDLTAADRAIEAWQRKQRGEEAETSAAGYMSVGAREEPEPLLTHYHHGLLTKLRAEELLLANSGHNANGKFLLRDYAQEAGAHIVSVVFQGRVVHGLCAIGYDESVEDNVWTVNEKPLPTFVTTVKQVVAFLRDRQTWWPCALTEGVKK